MIAVSFVVPLPLTPAEEVAAFRARHRHAPPHVHRCPTCYEPEACGLDCSIEHDLALDNGTPCGGYLTCSACQRAAKGGDRG